MVYTAIIIQKAQCITLLIQIDEGLIMNKKFETPMLKIIFFDNSDIITDSEPGDFWKSRHEFNPLFDEEDI